MKLAELEKDLTIKAVRRKIWALPTDRLELPPVVNGHRGIWAVLVGHDGVDPNSRTNICMALLGDSNDDWEVWTDTDPYVDRRV